MTVIATLSGAAFALPAMAAAEDLTPDPCAVRHPINDAWFTGPLLANSAATGPKGHLLVEPYVYDVTTQGAYSSTGKRETAPHGNGYGSLTYIIYALTDRTGIGLSPTFGYNQVSQGLNSSSPGIGDLSFLSQYRLTAYHPCTSRPIISAALLESFPTGHYDQLGDRPSDGLGSGAFTTTLALYTQTYFWTPGHRIVRMRLNASEAFSTDATVKDVSVYGTNEGFRGSASPGDAFTFNAAGEYSITRRWVLASDAYYRHSANTTLSGYPSPGAAKVTTSLGTSDVFYLAPAVEYSWKPWIGVIAGVRASVAGRNTSETLTPVMAINIVH